MNKYMSLHSGFWKAPDDALVQPGGEGELVISRVRATMAIVGLGITLVAAFLNPFSPEIRVYQMFLTLAAAVSLVLHLIVSRVVFGWWLGFVTSVVDVTLVSVAIAAFLTIGSPAHALNGAVLFPAYFYALAATTVRLDHRACLVAGLTAAGQYLLIVGLVALLYGFDASFLQPGMQAVRVVLLLGMSALGVVVNQRMQRPYVLSANDSLTGLLNRRAFEERWESELARARRYGRPISIAVIDIDYFKQFNDRFGHAGGDTALVAVATALRNRTRSTDFVGRLGGEEFVVAMPETASSSALAVADKLREAVAEKPLLVPGSRTPTSVTISVGVASWPEHGEEISRLLDRADDRMYQAKLAGKNRVMGPSRAAAPLGTPVPF